MDSYLIIQSTYTDVEVGLARHGKLIEKKVISKLQASSHIDVAIEELLSQHKIEKKNLIFIAANCGPGPFTTLRVVLATANGLGYGLNKPLIGLDGMQTFLEEHHSKQYPVTVALLNAFSNDVYFGIDDHRQSKVGWENAHSFLKNLQEKYSTQPIRFIGSGVQPYQQLIQELFGDQAVINSQLGQCSLEYCAQRAWKNWERKEMNKQLMPLYLKNQLNSMPQAITTH